MISSILVPLDGSAFGEHALPFAAGLARRAGAELHLAHAHLPVPPVTLENVAFADDLDQLRRQDEQAYLAGVSRRMAGAANTPARMKTALIDGDVAASLKEYAAKVGAGLVVMSTHGRGAFGRFWLGSVADQVLRDMPRPVLLVRPHEGSPDMLREPALKHIVLPLDGTPHAEKVLEAALGLGKLFGAEFTLLRVVKPVVSPTYLPDGSAALGMPQGVHKEVEHLKLQLEQLQKQHQEEAQRYLEGVKARLVERGVQVRTRVTVEEYPAVGILREAAALHADLIAIVTHGRRGLSRLLLGSVADKVVRGAGVPVLLHRQPQ